MSNTWGTVGSIGGGIIGAYYGGPMGAQMGAGAGGALGGMFDDNPDEEGGSGGYKNPADAGMGYLNGIPDETKPYYDPYINAGRTSLEKLMAEYGKMTDDPGALMNRMGSGFQQSPGYQFQMNQAMNAANNAAASGGMSGTQFHQGNAASLAGNIANQDYYNYLGNTMGLYQNGIAGYQDTNHMGYDASDAFANMIASTRLNQAGMAYGGVANQNKAMADKEKYEAERNSGLASMFGQMDFSGMGGSDGSGGGMMSMFGGGGGGMGGGESSGGMMGGWM